MNQINPVQPVRPPVEPPAPGVVPSNSTNMTALGGALATVAMVLLGAKGITFPAGAEAALAVIFATICGYLPASGRK